jgi:hypothetical protein
MPRLFVYGFPGLYGGAATELHHQIHCWKAMGIDVAIIPSMHGSQNEPLLTEMVDLGISIYGKDELDHIKPEDAIINFCSKEYLELLPEIVKRTKRTIFVNCMTWVFQKPNVSYQFNEGYNHSVGNIAVSLYQRPQVRDLHQSILRRDQQSRAQFLHFQPYFRPDGLVYSPERNFDRFSIGRISRQDADKFTKNLWHVWEYVVSPTFKRGICLGWDSRSESKCGKPPEWVETYADHKSFSTAKFWAETNVICQPSETNENWPRIGFEAMYSGVPLIVDKRAGWNFMVEHGVTGFLCAHERDFIYYASKMAYEPEHREAIARAAYARALELSSLEVSMESWQKVFDVVFQ